jgi:alpha-L-arabinofuranosidase
MEAALSVAAFMTSLEKNADVVQFASYAPLFSRDGYTQWYPDMIGFDESRVFGTPDYYVQSMYSNNLGSYTLESETENNISDYTPHGMVGLGTWNTAVEYSDVEIVAHSSQEDNPIEIEDLGTTGGEWDNFNQTSKNVEGAFKFLANPSYSNYTITFTAKKTDGYEGFCIPLLWEDENNYYLWNVGGWNNSYSAIQQAVNGVKSEVSVQNTAATIETGREYSVKIEVTPTKIACYLDGECINFVSFKQNVYSTSSFDETTGDIIIKAVNTASSPIETRFVTESSEEINPIADVTELKTDNIYTVNTLSEPEKVSPSYFETEVSDNFTYILPANSFTIFRIHTKDDGSIAAYSEDVTIEVQKGDSLSLPETVNVIYKDGSSAEANVTWDAIPDEFTSKAGVKVVEGTIENTNIFAHATVTISEIEEPSLNDPQITVTDSSVLYSVSFTEYSAEIFSTKAILAGYNENGELVKVSTVALNSDNTDCEISLEDFSEAKTVKAFIFDKLNNVTDFVVVR